MKRNTVAWNARKVASTGIRRRMWSGSLPADIAGIAKAAKKEKELTKNVTEERLPLITVFCCDPVLLEEV